MIKLKNILQEIQSKDTYYLDKSITVPRSKIQKFFEKNKDTIKQLVDLDDYDSIYKMGYAEFPKIPQENVAQYINNELLDTKWLTREPTIGYNEKISFDIDETSDVWQIDQAVSKWVKKNKTKLTKLADDNDYAKFNSLAKKAFPKAQEDKLMQALQAATIEHSIHYELITD